MGDLECALLALRDGRNCVIAPYDLRVAQAGAAAARITHPISCSSQEYRPYRLFVLVRVRADGLVPVRSMSAPVNSR